MTENIVTLELLRKALKKILMQVPPPAIFALYGHPGAGKTTLVQTAASLLQVSAKVQSPTFNLLNVYEGLYFDGSPIQIFHMDFYRLDNYDTLDDLHFNELSPLEKFYAFIEWPQNVNIKKLAPDIKIYDLKLNTKWNPEENQVSERSLTYDFGQDFNEQHENTRH